MLGPIDGASLLPEENTEACPLEDGHADHDVVICVPRQAALDDHGSSNQGREEGAEGVARVHETQNMVGSVHAPSPGAVGRIRQAVAEATQSK